MNRFQLRRPAILEKQPYHFAQPSRCLGFVKVQTLIIVVLLIAVAVLAYLQFVPKQGNSQRLQQASAMFDSLEAQERAEAANRDAEHARNRARKAEQEVEAVRQQARSYEAASASDWRYQNHNSCNTSGDVYTCNIICVNGQGQTRSFINGTTRLSGGGGWSGPAPINVYGSPTAVFQAYCAQ